MEQTTGEYILKAVNASKERKPLELLNESGEPLRGTALLKELQRETEKDGAVNSGTGAAEEDGAVNSGTGAAGRRNRPEPVRYEERSEELDGILMLAPESFVVARMKVSD